MIEVVYQFYLQFAHTQLVTLGNQQPTFFNELRVDFIIYISMEYSGRQTEEELRHQGHVSTNPGFPRLSATFLSL